MINIGRKQPPTLKKVMEAISGQQITGRYNSFNIITARRDNDI